MDGQNVHRAVLLECQHTRIMWEPVSQNGIRPLFSRSSHGLGRPEMGPAILSFARLKI
jgi:hypothetical protein